MCFFIRNVSFWAFQKYRIHSHLFRINPDFNVCNQLEWIIKSNGKGYLFIFSLQNDIYLIIVVNQTSKISTHRLR